MPPYLEHSDGVFGFRSQGAAVAGVGLPGVRQGAELKEFDALRRPGNRRRKEKSQEEREAKAGKLPDEGVPGHAGPRCIPRRAMIG